MSKFNTKEFGEKIKEVEQEIGKTIKYFIEHETKNSLINYISGELKNTLINQNDLTKALAIIDYVTHSTTVSGDELPINHEVNGNVSLFDTANFIGQNDLANELVGLCKTLNYISE